MDTTKYDSYQQEPLQPARPDFLKILCILSFVACGLWILVCAIGTMALALEPAAIEKVWTEMVAQNPQFEGLDAITFIHNFGMLCVYMLIANIFSLIGVIMMWRLEKSGIIIYAIAELATDFFKFDMGQEPSYTGMIFWIIIDLVFVAMYFTNLKHMKKNTITLTPSGD